MTPSTRWRWGVGRQVILWSLVATAVVEQIRSSWFVAPTVTNDDATLLWYAAQEWGHHQVHQPGFYGQAYGSTLEGLSLDGLWRLGIDPWVGLPIVMGVFALGGWLLLAVAAWRRSHPALAAAAVATPMVLSAYHNFFVTNVVEGTAPRFLAVAGVAVLITPRLPLAAQALALSLLSLGLVMDPSSALLGAPVVLWFFLSERRTRDRVVALAAGAVIPAAWLVWSWTFFRAHPDYNLHGAASIRPSWHLLSHNLAHLGGFFDLYVPEVAHFWLIPAGLFVLLVAVLVASRKAIYVAPGVGALALLCWGLATPKADPLASLGKFLPPGRLFLILPYLLWFFALLVTESGILSQRRVPTRGAMLGLVALVAVSVGVRSLAGRALDVRDEAVVYGHAGYYSFEPVANVRSTCADVRRVTQTARASIAVFLRAPGQPFRERTLAYGCGALAQGALDTLEPNYERRTWRLYEELHRGRTAAVLWGVEPNHCQFARWRVERCDELMPGVVGLTFTRQSVLALLASLEITVRPFGPHCKPKIALASVGCTHPLELSLRDLVTGPPPADRPMAQLVVDQRFSHMFDVGTDGHLVNVEGAPPPSAAQRQRLEATTGSAPKARVKDVHFLDPRQALVEFVVTSRNERSRKSTLTGRAILVDNSWLVTQDTFCRSAYVSGLGQC